MKERMLQTCIQLFEEKGFSETSIQDIVEAEGVTKGTFYYYFSSKEEVLMTIHRLYIDTLLEQQAVILSNPSLTNGEKLRQLIGMLVSNIAPHGDSARVFFRELRHLSAEHLEEVRPKRDRVRKGMQKVIEAGVSAGEFRSDLDPSIVTLGILGACNWTYQWFNPYGRVSADEVADTYMKMIGEGIEE
ncbi:TetR/AcrR family transcriptional regulator [Bacillaceae bacterium S4-13-56]